jgi:fucose permease
LGVYYFCAIEGGGVLTPVMGALVDHFGFYTAFTAAGSAIVLITSICAPLLRGRHKPVISGTG